MDYIGAFKPQMPDIYGDLRDLLLNPRHADLHISCEDGACFKVHRTVIALHSPTLHSMIVEERDGYDQFTSRIRLTDINSDIVYMMLQFLYGGNYNDYETFKSFHAPSYVVFLTPEQIYARLETLPCLEGDASSGDSSVDGDYDDEQAQYDAETETEEEEEEGGEGEVGPSSPDGDSHHDSHHDSSPGSNGKRFEVDRDRDERRIRTFQGHNLFDSLQVYIAASRFGIAPLKLLARDRFYRTAEKVLMFSPADAAKKEGEEGEEGETKWSSHDHQRIYRSNLAEAVFNDFPDVVDELYQTIPESDTMMRAIPPLLIAAGYNNDGFRDQMRPVLEKYPELTLAVIECQRIPACH
ncbi:hypothetical protein GGS21DRAFT_487876 [Xylaria nigripes]|nr:hypothetical protein GGS21DRAFT_487876 [Xylaria nigripes]